MAALVRPSLILKMDLDENVYSDEAVSEIKRSYSYVAPAVVAAHETAGGPSENVMRFAVKLHKPYWDKNDPAADELWQGVMPKWLRNMFYKVSSTIVAANNTRAREGRPPLAYDWVELEFGSDALIALKTRADSSIPEEAVGLVEQVRDLMTAGAFGDAPACVRVPSRASLEAQRAAALAAAQAEAEAEGDPAVEEDAASEAAPEAAAPAFEVDYAVWGIERADGSVEEFDASAQAR